MKAAIYERYGPPDVVHVTEIGTPVCGPDQVLVRVHAATVSSADWRARTLSMPPGFGLLARPMFGFKGPRNKVLGVDFAGIVEETGADVTGFQPGDAVFGLTGLTAGGHAEYLAIKADGAMARKPDALSFEQAASLAFGGSTALNFLRDRAGLKAGQSVLINGAAGAVGTAAVQIAKSMGLVVTAVCSAANAELAERLGADHIIDYTRTDFASTGEEYDAIMDVVGNAPFMRCKRALKPKGQVLVVLGGMGAMLGAPWQSLTSGHKVHAGPAAERASDMEDLAALAASGRFTPVIDSIYPLAEIVAAHKRVDTGHKRGNVVISMAPARLSEDKETAQ